MAQITWRTITGRSDECRAGTSPVRSSGPSHTPPPLVSRQQAGEEVGGGVVSSRNVTDGEPVWLHGQVPAGDPSIGITHAVHPLQWSVVRLQEELAAQEVVPESIKGPFDRQALLLDRGVTHLPWKQLPADVGHRMSMTWFTLQQHRSYACIRSVSLQHELLIKVRTVQNRLIT